MEITAVRISLLEEGQIRAFTSITLTAALPFVTFRSRNTRGIPGSHADCETPGGTFTEVAFPLNAKTQDDRGQGNLRIQESDCRKPPAGNSG